MQLAAKNVRRTDDAYIMEKEKSWEICGTTYV